MPFLLILQPNRTEWALSAYRGEGHQGSGDPTQHYQPPDPDRQPPDSEAARQAASGSVSAWGPWQNEHMCLISFHLLLLLPGVSSSPDATVLPFHFNYLSDSRCEPQFIAGARAAISCLIDLS